MCVFVICICHFNQHPHHHHSNCDILTMIVLQVATLYNFISTSTLRMQIENQISHNEQVTHFNF